MITLFFINAEFYAYRQDVVVDIFCEMSCLIARKMEEIYNKRAADLAQSGLETATVWMVGRTSTTDETKAG